MTDGTFGDDVLVGYTVEAHFPDGTIDSARIVEPKIDYPEGVRAITKLHVWRQLYAQLGATSTTVTPEWMSRSDAIAQGFIRGS